jgi:YqaJ-like viral recombinase domain
MPELVPAEPLSPEWLAARRAGVTATDIVTILGLSHWDSVYSLFWRKMQQAPEVEDNDRFRLGRALESYTLRRWRDENGLPLLDGNKVIDYRGRPSVYGGGLYRHSERTWQMATPDAAIGIDWSQWSAVIEVKSWADADKSSWQDAPPAQVRAQVLWQMDVMEVSTGHVGVVFLPSGEFRSYTIEHDGHDQHPSYYEDCTACNDLEIMLHAGDVFMRRLRLELPPPDPDSSAATLAAVRARFTRQPDKQAEINADVWYAFEAAREDLDAAKEEARVWEINVREQAGEASVLTVDGQPVARMTDGEIERV